MARFVALEWDDREVRLLVASPRGASLDVEEALALPLDGDASPAAIGGKIAAALRSRNLGRVETLIAVGRSSVELKRLSLPPSPDEELPELVRFQAEREFTALSDGRPLDFSPLNDDPTAPRVVLAAVAAPDVISRINETAEAAGLKPRRLVLRPCATAALARRLPQQSAADGPSLLVDAGNAETDLTVMHAGRVVILRTVRLAPLAADSPESARPLIAEIRRTMAAAENQLGGGLAVRRIDLCAGGDATWLADLLGDSLEIVVQAFDPFDGLALPPARGGAAPVDGGRFAPLVGMLLDEAAQATPTFDFLNPRRAAEPPSQRGRYTALGVAAVVLLVVTAAWHFYSLHQFDRAIADLQKVNHEKQIVVDRYAEVEKSIAEIDRWAEADIEWLSELRTLSERFPESRDAMLTTLRLGPHADGGEIQLEGLVREAANIAQLESGLRDERRRIEGNDRQQEVDPKHYAWQFNSLIVVDRPEAGN